MKHFLSNKPTSKGKPQSNNGQSGQTSQATSKQGSIITCHSHTFYTSLYRKAFLTMSNAFLGTIRFLAVCFVSIVFLFAGTCKLTPALHADTFYELDNKFRGPYIKIIQNVLTNVLKTKYSLKPTTFKSYVGIVELVSILLIWTGNGQIGGSCLAAIMAGACYVHVSLKEDFVFPAVLGGLSLLISWLSIRKPGKPRPPRVGKPLRPETTSPKNR